MPKYLVKDLREGESDHYYAAIGHAPKSLKLPDAPRVGDHLALDFLVDAIPGFSPKRRDCEVVDVRVVGRWPLRKNILYIKPATTHIGPLGLYAELLGPKQTQPKCTSQPEASIDFGRLRFNSDGYPKDGIKFS